MKNSPISQTVSAVCNHITQNCRMSDCWYYCIRTSFIWESRKSLFKIHFIFYQTNQNHILVFRFDLLDYTFLFEKFRAIANLCFFSVECDCIVILNNDHKMISQLALHSPEFTLNDHRARFNQHIIYDQSATKSYFRLPSLLKIKFAVP